MKLCIETEYLFLPQEHLFSGRFVHLTQNNFLGQDFFPTKGNNIIKQGIISGNFCKYVMSAWTYGHVAVANSWCFTGNLTCVDR